ncbi:MAG: amylo-alpha-1,6-glucosidase [Clostridiales bacterium]|nr:amylo-alpha-1,6-glucosidase [Clostridiales bacterium]
MNFIYGKQDFPNLRRGQETCWLLTNGLGGFSAQTITGGVSRCDQAVLMACTQPPNRRWNLIHRLEEALTVGETAIHLSAQQLEDGEEDGWRWLSTFRWDGLPCWRYHVRGVEVEKRLAMAFEENTVAVTYRIWNDTPEPCTLTVTPWMLFVPKGAEPQPGQALTLEGNVISAEGLRLHVSTNGTLVPRPLRGQWLRYEDDARDGRRGRGQALSNCCLCQTVPAGAEKVLEAVFSTGPETRPVGDILRAARQRVEGLADLCGLESPAARQLAVSADAFLSRRQSTGGKTILAGYPLFEDWGRDTMIALPGCALTTGRYQDAKSILRTFMAYEREGLLPNLFPEGSAAPEYNTVDAALLFINDVYLYHWRTGDDAFLREAYPVMARIVACYRRGTAHGIRQDGDGLLTAGEGLDQVTWMDVRVGDILPTPRHGKPVEVNAYWYNALRILERFAPLAGADGAAYGAMAERTRRFFRENFWMEDKHCLKDLLSGTRADRQIRCNQIWAVSLPFTMLPPEQEKQAVRTVFARLYTPVGLRTLDPEDPEFHATYGGPQFQRDMAYHQGTVWAYPLGAYYLAYLKTEGYSAAAKERVRRQLDGIEAALREGCVGQLPEIYDGGVPTFSRGCFAQAWSVGELLRVYEALEGKGGYGLPSLHKV